MLGLVLLSLRLLLSLLVVAVVLLAVYVGMDKLLLLTVLRDFVVVVDVVAAALSCEKETLLCSVGGAIVVSIDIWFVGIPRFIDEASNGADADSESS